jgi:hypothetical protein
LGPCSSTLKSEIESPNCQGDQCWGDDFHWEKCIWFIFVSSADMHHIWHMSGQWFTLPLPPYCSLEQPLLY